MVRGRNSADRARGRASVPAFAAAALVPAAATAAAFSPELFVNPLDDVSGRVRVGWLALLLCAAPLAAVALNLLRPVATTKDRAVWLALPQIVVFVALVRVDVWLDVRSGYLLADSGEEAMAYGLGMIAALIAGVLVAGPTAAGARWGAHRAARRRGSHDAAQPTAPPPAKISDRAGKAMTIISAWLAIPVILIAFLVSGGVVPFALVCLALVLVNLLGWRLRNGVRHAHTSHDAA